MVRETALYDILGVSPNASEQEIRRAYKQKAVQMHPDKGGDEDQFKELCHAHQVLSDPEKRRMYDLGGADAVSSDAGGGGPSGGGGMADFLGAMFGGGGPRREQKPRDIVHSLDLPLSHLYRGKPVKLAITRNRFCDSCSGTGSRVPGKSATCQACNGAGKRILAQQIGPMISQTTVPCSQCNGRGTAIAEKDKCTDCKGRQTAEKRDVFTVNVTPGTASGDRFVFESQGEQVPGIRLAGDVVVVVKEKPHEVFTRLGKHLLIDQSLTLADALCGFRFVVQHLDGRRLIVQNKPGQVIKPGIYSVHHEGMPVKGSGGFDKGDLLIKVTVIFPPSISTGVSKEIRGILGDARREALPCSSTDFYETHMRETTIDIAHLAGKDDESSDDEGPRGMPQAQCTTA